MPSNLPSPRFASHICRIHKPPNVVLLPIANPVLASPVTWQSCIWRTQVVIIPLKSSFVPVLQALLYLLKPPILLDDNVDDTRMSNFMSCVMQDVTILLWQTPDDLWHRFPLHHPLGHFLPRAPEWMVYTVLRHCSTPESLISAQSPPADTVTSLFWLQCWLQLIRRDLIVET